MGLAQKYKSFGNSTIGDQGGGVRFCLRLSTFVLYKNVQIS